MEAIINPTYVMRIILESIDIGIGISPTLPCIWLEYEARYLVCEPSSTVRYTARRICQWEFLWIGMTTNVLREVSRGNWQCSFPVLPGYLIRCLSIDIMASFKILATAFSINAKLCPLSIEPRHRYENTSITE